MGRSFHSISAQAASTKGEFTKGVLQVVGSGASALGRGQFRKASIRVQAIWKFFSQRMSKLRVNPVVTPQQIPAVKGVSPLISALLDA
jgi:hypothetical protein